jgi:hypothetical protein
MCYQRVVQKNNSRLCAVLCAVAKSVSMCIPDVECFSSAVLCTALTWPGTEQIQPLPIGGKNTLSLTLGYPDARSQ